MSFAYYSAMYQQERAIIDAISTRNSGKTVSGDIFSALIELINAQIGTGHADRQMIAMIRLAIKLNPYSGDIPMLSILLGRAAKSYAEATYSAIFDTFKACRGKNLPLPVIVSCQKYMAGALKLQTAMEPHYFGIRPIIVCGDTSRSEESYADGVLTLPVDDTYEGVPLKMMELYTLLSALDDKVGIIKIDDDCEVKPNNILNNQQLSTLFNMSDYIGIAVQNTFHDRMWHYKKCAQPVPFSYGKPIKSAWARGALYYLSNNALQLLTRHYLRFPGLLEGEVFEDKAVADMLYDNNIRLTPYPLELPLALDTTSPDR